MIKALKLRFGENYTPDEAREKLQQIRQTQTQNVPSLKDEVLFWVNIYSESDKYLETLTPSARSGIEEFLKRTTFCDALKSEIFNKLIMGGIHSLTFDDICFQATNIEAALKTIKKVVCPKLRKSQSSWI